MLLISLLAPSTARAQGTESSYDPCALASPPPPSCLNGSRSCDGPQQICSPGYCWASGVPSINAGIPLGGLVENKVIDIGGTYTITIGVTFKNCTFRMLGDARVNISPVGDDPINVVFDNCDFFGCYQMWQGIVVDVSAALGGLNFAFFDGNIEDAYKGLTLDENGVNAGPGGSYQISNNTFRNNHIGITNLRYIGHSLNAIIRKNQFFQTSNLATRVGSLNDPNLPVPMPGYPLAYAGVKLVNLNATVGVNIPAEANMFSCLLNGLITEGIRNNVISVNNTFERITNRGIWSTQGYIGVFGCTFGIGSGVCVFTESSSLDARSNIFGGNWIGGVHSIANNNAQFITINNQNQFNIVGNLWTFGVFVERPQALSGAHCTIDHNTFTVGGAVKNFVCIALLDLVDASDDAIIAWNTINVNSTTGPVYGISTMLGNSDKLKIEENIISYGTTHIGGAGSFAIQITPVNDPDQNASQGHVVKHNTITGPDISIDALTCAIHSESVQGIEYCDNILDFSYRGLHYKNDCGDVALRQNHMQHHTKGLDISALTANDMPGIGLQYGRGNTWNIPPGDCMDKAVNHDVPLDSMNIPILITSLFRVPEFTSPPFRYYPLPVKISPDPTDANSVNFLWFRELGVDIDYCVPGLAPESSRQLTAYEKQLVDGLSPYTGVTLWDLKLRTYTKLLLHPALRPAGSPEETFLASLANTSISSFGQVIQMMGSSLALPAADQQLFDNYNSSVQQAAENLAVWDASQDYSSTSNLTDIWFAARLVLLQALAANTANLAALEISRNALVTTNLQNVLAYNAGISTTLPYEAANKALYDIWLRRLLQEPLTEAYYEQILALAQQDPATAGKAARAAANFVAPCDRYLFQYDDGEPAQRGSVQARADKAIDLAAFRISPNPSSALVEISLSLNMATSFVVINAYGQKVHHVELAAGTRNLSLDLAKLPSGLYWGVLLDAQGQRIGIEALALNH
ncbi:MAG: hypothetical protein ACKVT2_13270 [Saprospiraceae bacterium]